KIENSEAVRYGYLSPALEGRHPDSGRKAVAGSEDRAAGLVWRAGDANDYYVVRANALEDNVVLYKTVNGVRSALDIVGRKGGYGVEVSVPSGRWLALRVEFKGNRFSVLYNGKH